MTRFTQWHEVGLNVLEVWEHDQLGDVVDVLSQLDVALCLTVDAEWVSLEISKPEPLPLSVVTALTC